MRVAVALSGGVDSATAAARLVAAGHEVVGVTLRLADLSACGLGASRCCSPGDLERAARVCWQLGIPHHVADAGEAFHAAVLEPFVAAYLQGRTPSPCVRCNSAVKLQVLAALADDLGCSAVATGHYARVRRDAPGRPELWRGADRDRDQSYFLFELSRGQLDRLLLPLGDSSKTEVRAEAARLGLASATQPDSQEICFVPPGGSYREVLDVLAGDRLPPPGPIVDTGGRVLGTHGGVHRFTVGQRAGLGVAAPERLYVVALDPVDHWVVVGSRHDLERRRLDVQGVSWLLDQPPSLPLSVHVQVRSRHAPVAAVVEALPGDRAEARLHEPVSAPAPGQAAVFYVGERVLGGGWLT